MGVTDCSTWTVTSGALQTLRYGRKLPGHRRWRVRDQAKAHHNSNPITATLPQATTHFSPSLRATADLVHKLVDPIADPAPPTPGVNLNKGQTATAVNRWIASFADRFRHLFPHHLDRRAQLSRIAHAITDSLQIISDVIPARKSVFGEVRSGNFRGGRRHRSPRYPVRQGCRVARQPRQARDFHTARRSVQSTLTDRNSPGRLKSERSLMRLSLVTKKIQPNYPGFSKRREVPAAASCIEAIIGADGRSFPFSLTANPNPDLTQAAQDAVVHWHV